MWLLSELLEVFIQLLNRQCTKLSDDHRPLNLLRHSRAPLVFSCWTPPSVAVFGSKCGAAENTQLCGKEAQRPLVETSKLRTAAVLPLLQGKRRNIHAVCGEVLIPLSCFPINLGCLNLLGSH